MSAYVWAEGTCFKGNADKCGREIESLPKRENEDLKAALISFARNKKTELHKCFEWDIKKQSELYLLDTAGRIIRSIMIAPKTNELPVRAFLKLNNSRNDPYIKISDIADDEFLQEQALAYVNREREMFERKLLSMMSYFKNPQKVKKGIKAIKDGI